MGNAKLKATPTRKIVQLAGYAAENGQSLFALCNDGTTWEYTWANRIERRWKPLAAIPQGKP